MKVLGGINGLELDERELDIWARANVRFSKFPSLRGRHLRAVATEHTIAVDAEDPEIRSIPTVEFPRAYELLERFVSNYEKLLESGIIRVNQLRRERGNIANDSSPAYSDAPVIAMETDMNTATVLKEVIGAQIHPEQLGNDAAA